MRFNQKNKGIVFILLIVLIVVAMTVVIAVSLKDDPINSRRQSDPVIKTLVLIEDEDKQLLFTDVLIYYPETAKGALVGVPGYTADIYRTLNRIDRIDMVYKEKGPEVYKEAVGRLLGLTGETAIPFYITIKLNDFCELTDLLSGFEVFVPDPVDVVSDNSERWLLPSGSVNLDGDKIRTYVTYQIPDENDAAVQERRQNAVIAFFTSLKRFRQTVFTKENFPLYSKRISSNVKDKDLFELLDLISQVDTERFETFTVSGVKQKTADEKELLMPYRNGDFIKDVVKKAANSITSPTGSANSRNYVLDILNGTEIKGLARNTRILLQHAGYDILDHGNAKDIPIAKTYIIDHIGNKEQALSIGSFIHCYTVEQEEASEDQKQVSKTDFTLVLGTDFDGRWVQGQSPENQ